MGPDEFSAAGRYVASLIMLARNGGTVFLLCFARALFSGNALAEHFQASERPCAMCGFNIRVGNMRVAGDERIQWH